MGHKKVQQTKFGGADGKALVIGINAVCDRVQYQTLHINLVFGHLRFAATQNRLDASDQFSWRKRLDHVVIGTDFQAGDPIILISAGSEHDDGGVCRTFVIPQSGSELGAGASREHPVEQDQIRQVGLDELLRFFGRARRHRAVTRALQINGQQFADGRIVFDDKYSCCHGLSRLVASFFLVDQVAAHLIHTDVANIHACRDVNHVFGNGAGMVGNAFNGFGHVHDFQRN